MEGEENFDGGVGVISLRQYRRQRGGGNKMERVGKEGRDNWIF